MKNKILLCFALLFALNSFGQDQEGKYIDLGLEVQQYPTGLLLGVCAEVALMTHHTLDLRVGYNLVDHQDFGVHEKEKGGGFGFTLGYRYYFKKGNRAWFLGARSDLWWNELDWKDNINGALELNGTTKITVFQPTAIAGYLFLLNEHWVITPTLAFGVEINVETKGEPVGEGAIVLWGINLARRF